MDLSRSFERAVEGAVHWSVQHRRGVLIGAGILTLLLVPGIFQISVHNRMTDWLDPDEPEAAAFLRGLEEIPAMVDFERSLLEYRGTDPAGLLSLESLREQERFVDAVRADVPDVQGAMGPVVAVQLTAYEMAKARGEDPTTARLPSDDNELQLAVDLTRQNQPLLLEYTLAENDQIGFIGFHFDAPPFEAEANIVGGQIQEAIDAAYAQGFDTLTGKHRDAIGVASVTDHVNDLLTRDILLLGGLGVGLVFVLFLVAAGRPVAVMGGFLSLALGLIWTVGALGWLQVPFNTLNFAILPLVMGNGIDYSIHVLAEAHADKRRFDKGLARHLGKALGVPIVLVTLTTCIGLGTLAFSVSPYLQQMGLIAAASIALIAILSLTFIPAFLATFARDDHPPRKERAGRLSLLSGQASRPAHIAIAIFVIAASGAGAYAFATTDYTIDVFEKSLPDGDPLVAAEQRYEDAWGNSDVWFLLIEGEPISDESFAFQERMVDLLVQRGLVADTDHVFDLPRLVDGHSRMRETPGGLGSLLGIPPLQEPASASQRTAAMLGEQPYRELSRVILSDDQRMSSFFILPPPEGQDVASTDAMQVALEAAVADADPPDDVDVQVYGYKRLARDLMGATQDSLQVLYAVSMGTTLVLFYALTRSTRATLVVALPVLVSSLWWFGLMRLFVGTLDVYQLLSLVFITSIGSDYAAYLVYKYRDTGDWAGTLSSTGRAVLFSAATDASAFFVFSLTRVRSGGQMLLGAGLAIIAIFVATLLIVPPLLRKLKAKQTHPEG